MRKVTSAVRSSFRAWAESHGRPAALAEAMVDAEVGVKEVVDADGTDMVDLLAIDDAMEKLASTDARLARVVELRFFGGLTIKEAAEVMQIAPSTADDDWALARSWLARELAQDPEA